MHTRTIMGRCNVEKQIRMYVRKIQAGWSCPVDNFASGCVFAELFSGEYLLPGMREEEHLKAIEIVMGECIPQVLFCAPALVCTLWPVCE